VLRNEQRLGARVIARAAEQLAAHYNSERIALAIASGLKGPELTALREKLLRSHHRTNELMATLHLPHMPSRDEFLAEASAIFARSPSLDGNCRPSSSTSSCIRPHALGCESPLGPGLDGSECARFRRS
jgi:hypothetical protein